MVVVVSVFKIMIEKVVRAFLLIFILVALAMIVATLLGFSTQVEEFLKTVVPTRYQIIANSDTYFRILSMGMLILAIPVIFYVAIRLLGMRESRHEQRKREKIAAENLKQYQQAFRERTKKLLNPPFYKDGSNKNELYA
jgi:hypothetical protein